MPVSICKNFVVIKKAKRKTALVICNNFVVICNKF